MVILVVGVMAAIPTRPTATDVGRLTMTELVEHSVLIFVGQVVDQRPRWNAGRTAIVTDYSFGVESVLLGNAEGRLILTFAGGQVGGEGQSVADVPTFNVGERVLLMIEDDRRPLLSPVTGMSQGKFIAGEADAAGHALARGGDGRLLRQSDGRPLRFAELVDQVKAEVRAVRENRSRPPPPR